MKQTLIALGITVLLFAASFCVAQEREPGTVSPHSGDTVAGSEMSFTVPDGTPEELLTLIDRPRMIPVPQRSNVE